MHHATRKRPRLSTNQLASIGLLFIFVACGFVEEAPAVTFAATALAGLMLALAIRREWRT